MSLKLIVLLLLIAQVVQVAFGQPIVSVGNCEDYNPTLNSCGRQVLGLFGVQQYQTTNNMAECPQGYIPQQLVSPNNGIFCSCQLLPPPQPITIQPVPVPIQRTCVTGTCPIINLPQCVNDLELEDGFYCMNGVAVPSLPYGAPCSSISQFECFHGACNSMGQCDSYVTALNSFVFPVVNGGNQHGACPCVAHTDCSYNVRGNIVPGASLGLGCLPTLYAPTQQFHCQFGGGEPIINTIAQYV